MISKKFKVLEVVKGNEYVFSSFAFKKCVNTYKAKVKMDKTDISVEQIYETIADSAHVSVDAVKNWMYGKNGPADLETVKHLAEVLKVDYMELLKIQEESNMPEKNVEMNMAMNVVIDMDKTKDVIRVVYQKMSAFMDAAVDELCFDSDEHTYWTYDEIYKDMRNTLHQSMLDIPISIYDKLLEIIEDDFYLYLYGIVPGVGVYVDLWEQTEYLNLCEKQKFNPNDDFAKQTFMQHESEKYYNKIREILKDYLLV